MKIRWRGEKQEFFLLLLPGESLVMILPNWRSVGLSFVCNNWAHIKEFITTSTTQMEETYKI
uniref:Uncharacterized protein n=1 Tax=Octopus bimaculoides TaxID=37653 RepID=A0A0L8H3D5_OCTBM